jgi:hypothetical protein
MSGEGQNFGKKEAAMCGFKTDFNWADEDINSLQISRNPVSRVTASSTAALFVTSTHPHRTGANYSAFKGVEK